MSGSARATSLAVARTPIFWVLSALLVAIAVALTLVLTRSDAAAASPSTDVAELRANLATAERDARFWRQLVAGFKPGKAMGLSSMSDHYVLRLPGGPVLALHFDNMNLAKAKNLNWVALALPGKFTRADQARINRLYGPGFTHFHDFETDAHGGKAGTEGVWFVHVGARNFTSPFGEVRQGRVDAKFMPTKAPR